MGNFVIRYSLFVILNSTEVAGIYIHIPFCKKRCNYCDFFSSTDTGLKEELIAAIVTEADLRKMYLENETVETIYIGGGTPSLLSPDDLNRILDSLFSVFIIAGNAEITLEANPDDLSVTYLKQLKQTPVNRLSIGVQSFNDEGLQIMGRRHNSRQAVDSVKLSRDTGFNNISIDLIYGLPGQTVPMWEKNLDMAFKMEIDHLSAYLLAYEPDTVIYKLMKQGKIQKTGQEESYEMFELLVNKAEDAGFIHYEISNFGKQGCFSKHNTNYWLQKKYLGLGPSAHSYNTDSRQWNITDNLKYIRSVEKGIVDSEYEKLDEINIFNEYIMLSLRTMWGCDLNFMREKFGEQETMGCLSGISKYINSGKAYTDNNKIYLTTQGKFISNRIISDLFIA